MYLWAGEHIYGQFRKTKPWFRAAEYAKSFFANFKTKGDEYILQKKFNKTYTHNSLHTRLLISLTNIYMKFIKAR